MWITTKSRLPYSTLSERTMTLVEHTISRTVDQTENTRQKPQMTSSSPHKTSQNPDFKRITTPPSALLTRLDRWCVFHYHHFIIDSLYPRPESSFSSLDYDDNLLNPHGNGAKSKIRDLFVEPRDKQCPLCTASVQGTALLETTYQCTTRQGLTTFKPELRSSVHPLNPNKDHELVDTMVNSYPPSSLNFTQSGNPRRDKPTLPSTHQ